MSGNPSLRSCGSRVQRWQSCTGASWKKRDEAPLLVVCEVVLHLALEVKFAGWLYEGGKGTVD